MNSKNLSPRVKVERLYNYIAEFNKVKQKEIINIDNERWHYDLSDIPNDNKNIELFYKDKLDADDTDLNDVIIKVRKPDFNKCPEPDIKLKKWLNDGWDDFRKEASHKDSLSKDDNSGIDEYYFNDDRTLVLYFNQWNEKRKIWQQQQKDINKTRDFFLELYLQYSFLSENNETYELVVADGFIKAKENLDLNYPFLSRRVTIKHDPLKNEIIIRDSDENSKIYSSIFQKILDINHNALNSAQSELEINDYHPLDRNDTGLFFKGTINTLSSKGIYSEDGEPKGWKLNDEILCYRNPCFILRKKQDGLAKTIGLILDDIKQNGEIPAFLFDIVDPENSVQPVFNEPKESVVEQLASIGGQSVDILLCKEANREQLEIAKRIELYNAVLVQGPPGTGKTHTIANLMGHFLAQGKKILVTSEKSKALRVLKEKLPVGLQDLCVSLIGDNNHDMEKSVEGITEYLDRNTSFNLDNERQNLFEERKNVLNELANTRKKLYQVLFQENENIVFNGESISPLDAAKYVNKYKDKFEGIIPGYIEKNVPLSLTLSEINELYRSNGQLSQNDENEISLNVPNPECLISPHDFVNKCQLISELQRNIKEQAFKFNLKVNCSNDFSNLVLAGNFETLNLTVYESDAFNELKEITSRTSFDYDWEKACAIDGNENSLNRAHWLKLVETITNLSELSKKVTSQNFGKKIQVEDYSLNTKILLEKLSNSLKGNNKIGFISKLFNKDLKQALLVASINGNPPSSYEECQVLIDNVDLRLKRDECATYWNELIQQNGGQEFFSLNKENPESVASKYIPRIIKQLDWFNKDYQDIISCLNELSILPEKLFLHGEFDSDEVIFNKIFSICTSDLKGIVNILEIIFTIQPIIKDLIFEFNSLNDIANKGSSIARELQNSIINRDVESYKKVYSDLSSIFAKSVYVDSRNRYLSKLRDVAPDWAEAIRRREGIHGENTPPDSIYEVWKWRQYSLILDELQGFSISELQQNSRQLNDKYQRTTVKLAEKSAWYHLLKHAEESNSLKQSLIAWRNTVKKIGKGTGKNAPKFRAQARKIMRDCQSAVPAWIMPVNKVYDYFSPQEKFDIVIVDEASQSDITSLALFYMGKKLVIVGDDKQVSPLAVGTDEDKVSNLISMYIKDVIRYSHLYGTKTSIYDIAKQNCQGLMLQEHFRCVPDIISFSNGLCYDYKIKPLREASSSNLLPAVVPYFVKGNRIGKSNPVEVDNIVALIQACLEQPEYKDKTFGVISLKGGDEQTDLIRTEIVKKIGESVADLHKILCGDASNFQGDERDVIFLSLVDSSDDSGPVRITNDGPDDAYKKRYNVATSRARDQLWIVHSLELGKLREGDLRKRLIEYALDPKASQIKIGQIEHSAESPFEEDVGKRLLALGYNFKQQVEVGAYRLDFAVSYQQNRIALECDGDRYHSSEEAVRRDLERQTILERLGWRFIRIRGSDFYRNPDQTMQKVVAELDSYGIKTEASNIENFSSQDSDLLQRVKIRANEYLRAGNGENVNTNSLPQQLATSVSISPTTNTGAVSNTPESERSNQGNSSSIEQPSHNSVNANTVEVGGIQQKSPVVSRLISNEDNEKDLFGFMQSNNLKYIDMRQKGGCLWIIGNKDLYQTVRKLGHFGYYFIFKEEGGKVTKHQSAWCLKSLTGRKSWN